MDERSTRRLAWTVAGLSVVLALAGSALSLATGAGLRELLFDYALHNLAAGVTFPVVAAVIVANRPRNRLGWILLGLGLVVGLNALAIGIAQPVLRTTDPQVLAVPPAADGVTPAVLAQWTTGWIWIPLVGPFATFVVLLFPDGRLPGPRWRWVAWVATAAIAILTVGFALMMWSVVHDVPLGEQIGTNPSAPGVGATLITFGFPTLAVAILGSVAALVVRFRRSQGRERQQLKLVTVVAALGATVTLATVPWDPVFIVAILVSMIALIAAIGAAIVRHRLYDIDVVISRTLVYTALAGFVTLLYVAIVVGVGSLLGRGDDPNLALSIVATAIVALAFQPARQRFHRIANRLVFGRQATPYEVLTDLSSRIGEAVAPDRLLPRIAELLTEGTAATGSAVWLRVGDELRAVASSPPSDAVGSLRYPVDGSGDVPELPADVVAPVVHHGELLGALTLTAARGENPDPDDEALLRTVATQVGLALRNLRLTAELEARLDDLRASRQRLVNAQDEERRRIERDIHDGAQQQLVALRIKVGLAKELVARERNREAIEMLDALSTDTDDAVESLRDLARGIYPPLLAAEGLGPALRAHAGKVTVPVEVRTEDVGRYPQEVEAAVYFCCLEALQNVTKYAAASTVTVELTGEVGSIAFSVTDDGAGFDLDEVVRGAGLTNMADRVDALGGELRITSRPAGGTTVAGRLPIPNRAPAPA